MNRRLLSCVIALAACSPELPSLPTADEDAPSQIQWVALETVDGAEAIAPEAFPAGGVARLSLRVLDQAQQPYRGASVTLSVRVANFADLLRFPEGNQCVSDGAGLCTVVLASRGEAGQAELLAVVPGRNTVTANFPLQIVASEGQMRIQFTVGGVGGAEWQGQGSDPLAGLDPMVLSADEQTARPLSVKLEDRYGNHWKI